ncbi:MAG: sigma-70 family RNA polymerase sigma factor [Planctomycetota bacterium]
MGNAASALTSPPRKRHPRRIKSIRTNLTQGVMPIDAEPRAAAHLDAQHGRVTTAASALRMRGLRVRRDGVVVHGVLDRKAELWRRYRRMRHRSLSERRALQERIVELYLPTVHRMAECLSFRAQGRADVEDLKSAAVVGLLRAIETFDPGRAIPFEGYLGLLVRGAVLDELRRQDWISREARDRVTDLTRARRKLLDSLGREPGDWEVARYLHISLRELRGRQAEAMRGRRVSLGGAAAEHAVLDLVEDAAAEPGEVAERRELCAALDKHLKPIERRIVAWHYQEGRRLREIARLLNLSESRICQIHGGLIERLKRKLGID